MGEAVPAQPTDESTCAHHSGFGIRVQVNEQIDTAQTDHMSSAWIRGKLKWANHETAAPTSSLPALCCHGSAVVVLSETLECNDNAGF